VLQCPVFTFHAARGTLRLEHHPLHLVARR
jgi:hypothetical protein